MGGSTKIQSRVSGGLLYHGKGQARERWRKRTRGPFPARWDAAVEEAVGPQWDAQLANMTDLEWKKELAPAARR
eukprot:11159041-Lingulodinium_polyedra.AAC.1